MGLQEEIEGTCTYERWAFDGHSRRLCSIRRTHYCSLGEGISSWIDSDQGLESECAALEHGRRLHIQPDRHEPDPRALVGARTYRRASHETAWRQHKRGRQALRVGGIQGGDSVLVLTRALVERRMAMAAVGDVSNRRVVISRGVWQAWPVVRVLDCWASQTLEDT